MSTPSASVIRLEQRCQQVVLGEVRQRRVGDALERFQPLRRVGGLPSRALLLVQPCVFDRERGAVGGELEQVAVVGREGAAREAADVQDAQHAAFDEQRNAEQRADAAFAQYGVVDVGVVDVVDRDRSAFGGDPAGEAAPERDRDAVLDRRFDPLGRPCAQRRAVGFEQQDRGGVRFEDLGDPAQQLVQQILP